MQTDDLLLRLDISPQMAIECFALDGHVNLVEGILHDVVGEELIDLSNHDVDVWLMRLSEEQELGTRQCLEAL